MDSPRVHSTFHVINWVEALAPRLARARPVPPPGGGEPRGPHAQCRSLLVDDCVGLYVREYQNRLSTALG